MKKKQKTKRQLTELVDISKFNLEPLVCHPHIGLERQEQLIVRGPEGRHRGQLHSTVLEYVIRTTFILLFQSGTEVDEIVVLFRIEELDVDAESSALRGFDCPLTGDVAGVGGGVVRGVGGGLATLRHLKGRTTHCGNELGPKSFLNWG